MSEDDVIVSRRDLDELHDRLYVLEAAIEDVERDLAGDAGLREYEEAVAWLLEAGRPLVDRRLFPEEGVT